MESCDAYLSFSSSKSKSEFYDPCQEAAQRSYKCLYRNGGDKTMCAEYFQCVPQRTKLCLRLESLTDRNRAYRDCKQVWVREYGPGWTNDSKCDKIFIANICAYTDGKTKEVFREILVMLMKLSAPLAEPVHPRLRSALRTEDKRFEMKATKKRGGNLYNTV